MLTMDMPTMARDLLRLMLMLTTDTHMPMVTDMPTADTTDTHTLTDGESKMLTKSWRIAYCEVGFSPSHK